MQVLSMFAPPELQQVVCGVQDIDFGELRRGAAYDGGYRSDSRVIEWFWDVRFRCSCVCACSAPHALLCSVHACSH